MAASNRVEERAAGLGRVQVIAYLAAALLMVAALIHFWEMLEEIEVWWGYGTFFLVAGLAQGLGALALLRWPLRPILLVGIYGNLALILMWVVTRTVGIPIFGPEAGEVEEVKALDLSTASIEVAVIVMLAMVLMNMPRRRVAV